MENYLKTSDFGSLKIVPITYCVKRVIEWFGRYTDRKNNWYWIVKLDNGEIVAYLA